MFYFESIFCLFIHLIYSFFLTCLLLFIVYLITPKNSNAEKNAAYECGFKPFEYGYFPFDIHFYRIGILFILFDVEILFFFPWLLNIYEIDFENHLVVFVFILLLIIGFVYEIVSGALQWAPKPWLYRV
jgi:NADH-quinone oxidoreductase subunit A